MKYINSNKTEIIKLTKDNFFVAIDFDKTITESNSDDSWVSSGRILGDKFLELSNALHNKYLPIELDYNISFEEKDAAMKEWYYTSLNLYYDCGLTKAALEKSIDSSNLVLRKGAKEFLNKMYELNVPVIILSAGIGNVIESTLKKNGCYHDNMYIIANFLEFDENGNLKPFSGNLIYTLNKTLNGHMNDKIKSMITNRPYRALFGDVIEDRKIIDEKEWENTILCSFLGKKVEENLDVFNKSYDIVLTYEDSTFDEARAIINI